MKLFAVIHEMIHGDQKITLVNANSKREAKKVYMNHVGLSGSGSQLVVDEVDISAPSVIVSITQREK